jgi:serine-type D-Ala-D-Ala endopeptidase (penicillin-binding protein 7)
MKIIVGIMMALSSLCYAAQRPSVLLYNVTDDKHVYNDNINVTRPIASITKLMTAMVTLDYDKNLTRKLMLSSRVGGSLPKQQYTRFDLLHAMLVRSDNAAAETLAEDYPGGRKAFIKAMNDTAKQHGMSAKFYDPSGLSRNNTGTASDVATLFDLASGYWVIRDTSTLKQVVIDAKFKKKVRKIILNNTNRPVLFEFDNVIVSKTGFTNPAGWCVGLVVMKEDKKYVVVILGAKSKKQRLDIVDEVLYNYVVDIEVVK